MCGRLGYELIYTDIVLVFMKKSTGIETTDQYENIGHCKVLLERGYIASQVLINDLLESVILLPFLHICHSIFL
jgi:hypothetical protein